MRSLFVVLVVAFCATATFARAVEDFEVEPTELIYEEDFDVEETLSALTPEEFDYLVDLAIEELSQEEELFEDEDEEVYIRISKGWFKRLLNKLKGKVVQLYKKACEKKKGHDVCKKWAKANINKKNLNKFWQEIKPLIKEYCSTSPQALCVAVRILM